MFSSESTAVSTVVRFAAGSFLAIAFGSCSWATMYDLSTSSAPPVTVNGAVYSIVSPHPTGTGFIDSFLRVQQKGTEDGFNTDARPYQTGNDDKTDATFDHSIRLSEVPLDNGFRDFKLDINEQANSTGNLLSFDRLQIFLATPATGGSLNDYSNLGGASGFNQSKSGTLSPATQVYNMDTTNGGGNISTDNWVKLNYLNVSQGSGGGDLLVQIPNASFASFVAACGGCDPYVYLYSSFGEQGGNLASGAGFEEWWVPNSSSITSSVPEPASAILMGTVLLGLAGVLRRRRRVTA